MERLKHMKEALVNAAEAQVYGNLDRVDVKELGEVIDMIKDLSEAVYYCSIYKAMEEGSGREERNQGLRFYQPQRAYYPDGRGDAREGRSGQRRRQYMENHNYKEKSQSMQELDSYAQELAQDITEMIRDASPEEKQMLQQKLNMLAQKVI